MNRHQTAPPSAVIPAHAGIHTTDPMHLVGLLGAHDVLVQVTPHRVAGLD